MDAAETMPKLALTMLSFASPALKFESELVGGLFAGLIPTPGGKSTAEIVLMAVAEADQCGARPEFVPGTRHCDRRRF